RHAAYSFVILMNGDVHQCRRFEAPQSLAASPVRSFKSISGTGVITLASALYFPKFVREGAATSNELRKGALAMLYAILCYHDEDFVGSWSKEQDQEVMKKLTVVQDKLAKQGRLGPVGRLLPTTAATTMRKENPPLVLDGPYAETKEQLLGFYLIDCKNLDEALDVARDLGAANPGGAYEIRPVGMFVPGGVAK